MKYSPTYERGYRAAAAGLPRKVPACVRQVLPSLSPEWFRGYDEAIQATKDKQMQALAGFDAY